MAWTAPRTWVAAETVTAALLNTHLRDNLLATPTALVTTAGDLVQATGANAMARLGIGTAYQYFRTNAGATAPEWFSVPQGHVYHNANQSIFGSTTTTLQFNSTRYLSGVTQGTGGATNSKLIAPIAGKYLAIAQVRFAANATGRRELSLLYNGGTTIAYDNRLTSSGTIETYLTVVSTVNLAANEYIEVQVYQDSGGALNIVFVNAYTPEFSLTLIQ